MDSLTILISSLVFAVGAITFIARRNVIVMVIGAELMLQGVVLNLARASSVHGDYGGQVLAAFVITVAACEAALALVLILNLYHRQASLDISPWSQLGEEVIPEPYEENVTVHQKAAEASEGR